ncbi:hypothetical protein [Maricaulis sp.]|uniref:hypothetical protein n=1 Tax=Maricaulis sp. TaxID=1486257 RepID=UPI0025C25323|nr:hypothetical protein [Maricaulis sp.]
MTRLTKLIRLGLMAGAANLAFGSAASADQVFNDDVIITQSLCVGFDCVNGENFGFDTLRLKENNLRIHFDDTSNSASFPSNDWRIVVNDTGNGGASYLGIEDSTAGRMPFRVEAGAPANTLYVEADGDVGIKTANPVVDLHIVEGNTPTVRLEQDGSDGFTPQTWDLAGNEANFFIRDVTNGSQLVFRIEPGASENRIFVESDNDVGIGTNNPSEFLHVRGTAGDTRVRIEEASATQSRREMLRLVNKGNPELVLENTGNGNSWIMHAGRNLAFEHGDAVGTQLITLTPTGDMTIPGTLTTGGGTCGGGCDAVFEDDFNLPSIEAHAAAMWNNGFLPNVGPTIEGEPINVSDKLGRMLNELETAHIYIAQLNDRLTALETRAASQN